MQIEDRLETPQVTNLLPFVSIPNQVSVVRLKTALRLRPSSLELAKAGVFIHNGDEIWSFTPLPVLTSALEPMVDPAYSQCRSHLEIEADSIARNVLSWLLRKHFEQYLWRFSAHGLVVDSKDPSGSRAFFRGQGGRPRKISYPIQNQDVGSRKVVVYCRGENAQISGMKDLGIRYWLRQISGEWRSSHSFCSQAQPPRNLCPMRSRLRTRSIGIQKRE
jgi:hypothetical protein